jgi:hypothetical protein
MDMLIKVFDLRAVEANAILLTASVAKLSDYRLALPSATR